MFMLLYLAIGIFMVIKAAKTLIKNGEWEVESHNPGYVIRTFIAAVITAMLWPISAMYGIIKGLDEYIKNR